MFGDNLKGLRKAKGYTQEELAIKLNVVRQTVSKWEKGLSVPDVDTLTKIADVLDTDVSMLLGREIVTDGDDENQIAVQLGKISEQLAVKNRRSKKIWKGVGIGIISVLLAIVLLIVFNLVAFNNLKFNPTNVSTEETIEIETEGNNLD